jgi:hypothetical protein
MGAETNRPPALPHLILSVPGLYLNRSPLTAHRSPLTARRSPLTAHRSLLTIYQARLLATYLGEMLWLTQVCTRLTALLPSLVLHSWASHSFHMSTAPGTIPIRRKHLPRVRIQRRIQRRIRRRIRRRLQPPPIFPAHIAATTPSFRAHTPSRARMESAMAPRMGSIPTYPRRE